MAEKLKVENEPAGADAKVDKGLAKIEAGDAASAPKGAEGFKSYIASGAKGLGISLAVLLGLAATAVLKIVEISARVLQGIAESPDKPEKWLEPLKKSFKKDKKEK